ncbi:MAG: GNAT family N-acetyltransferase [Firmicutes bacterium]|nr:GNAT family N-acetyltransferase [Bacillota bacterium]
MKGNEMISFSTLKKEDVESLTQIMTRAFDEDSKIHLGKEKGGPPGYDTGDFLMKWGLHKDSSAYKIYYKEELIGGIILWIKEDGNNSLGCMFIDPKMENEGIGTQVWSLVEHNYPNTKKWRTETPGFSKRNHNFYVNKCGFKIVEIKYPGSNEFYILEKEM